MKTQIKYRSINKKWLGIVGKFAVTKSGDIYFHPSDEALDAYRWMVSTGDGQWYIPVAVGTNVMHGLVAGLHFDVESMRDIGKCMKLFEEYLAQ